MFDAIVVGAGPAGTTSALTLARAGARVLLVDRAPFPRAVPCGGLLSAAARAEVAALGLGDVVAPIGRVQQWRIRSPDGDCRHRLPIPDAVLIDRATFDHRLLNAAIGAGVRFEHGWHARRLLVAEGRIVRGLELKRRDATLRIPALMVVAADGARSRLARAAGLVRRPAASLRTWTTVIEGAGAERGTAELFLASGAYGRVTPHPRGLHVSLTTRRQPASRDIRAEALAMFPALGEYLEASQTGATWSRVRVNGPARVPGVPGLVLAGDAVAPANGVVDGIGAALAGGQLAARIAMRTIETGEFGTGVEDLMAWRAAALAARLESGERLDRLIAASALGSTLAFGLGVARRRAVAALRGWEATGPFVIRPTPTAAI